MILINAEELHLGRRMSPNSKHAARIRSPKSLAPSQSLTTPFIFAIFCLLTLSIKGEKYGKNK